MSQCVECHIPLSEASERLGPLTYHDALGNRKTGQLCQVCITMLFTICEHRFLVNAAIDYIKENRRLAQEKHSLLGE